jgi:hypothetical protein
MVNDSSVGSFEEELASLRGFVVTASIDELTERTFFYFEYLEKLRLIIRKLDSTTNSKQLSSDLADEQRWSILLGVCEVELKRRGCPLTRF